MRLFLDKIRDEKVRFWYANEQLVEVNKLSKIKKVRDLHLVYFHKKNLRRK